MLRVFLAGILMLLLAGCSGFFAGQDMDVYNPELANKVQWIRIQQELEQKDYTIYIDGTRIEDTSYRRF